MNASPPSRRDDDTPLHITGDYLVEQFKTLMPVVHLTLVSVLQGLALGALILNFGPPRSFLPSDLLHDIPQHAFYLPHIASLLIMISIWNEYMAVVITTPWPLNSVNTGLQLLLVMPEFAALASVNQVGGWMFWGGVTAIMGGIIRLRDRYIVSRELYRRDGDEAGKTPYLWRLRFKRAFVWHFWLSGPVYMVLGFLRATQAVPLLSAQVRVAVGSVGIAFVPFDVLAPLLAIIVLASNLHFDDRHFTRYVNATWKLYGIPYHLNRRAQAVDVASDEQAQSARVPATVEARVE